MCAYPRTLSFVQYIDVCVGVGEKMCVFQSTCVSMCCAQSIFSTVLCLCCASTMGTVPARLFLKRNVQVDELRDLLLHCCLCAFSLVGPSERVTETLSATTENLMGKELYRKNSRGEAMFVFVFVGDISFFLRLLVPLVRL